MSELELIGDLAKEVGLNVIADKASKWIGIGEDDKHVNKGYYWEIRDQNAKDDLASFNTEQEMMWLEFDRDGGEYTDKTYSMKKEYIEKIGALQVKYAQRDQELEVAPTDKKNLSVKDEEKKPVSQPASVSEEVKKSSADESKDSSRASETPAPEPSSKNKSGKEKKEVVVDKDHLKKEIGGKTRQVVEMLLQPESKRSPFLQGLIYFLPNKEGVEFDVVNRDKMKEALAEEIKKGSIDTYSMIAVSALYKDGGIEKNDKDQFAIKSECNKQLKNSLSKEEYQRIGLTINALNHVDFGDKSDSPALKAFDGYRRSMIDPGFKENKQFDKDMQLIVETEGKVTGSSKAAMRQMEQGLDQGRNFNILNKMASNPELSSLLKGKTIDNLSNSFNKGIDSGLGSVREMEAANDTKAREKEMVGLNKVLDKKREKEMSKSRGKGSIEK